MSTLITGASGAIGANLAHHLAEQSLAIVSILHDITPSDCAKALGVYDNITWVQGDVTDVDLVRRIIADYDVHEVYHLAALPIVRVGFQAPASVYHTNVFGTLAVLEAIRNQTNAGHGIRMLHLSTDKVYGETKNRGCKEEDCLRGMAPYENSKTCADLVCQCYAETFGLDIRIIRSCNMYGPGDMNSRVIPNTIRTLLAGKPAVIWKGVSSVREYIYVKDLVRAMELVMNNGKAKGVFNVGSGELKNQNEVIREILKHFKDGAVVTVDPPAHTAYEIQYQALDHSKISRTLGWHATTTLENGIEATVEWWRNHVETNKRTLGGPPS